MADTREFNSSMSTPQSGSANLDITINGATTNYNPFGPDKAVDIVIPQPATDAVKYGEAQALTDAQESQARSNIGITPHTVYVSGMVVDTVHWTDKGAENQWKAIRNPGVIQSLYVYGGKPTIVRVQLGGAAYGDFAQQVGANIPVEVRLTDGSNIFDSVYIDIPINAALAPGIQVPCSIIFMNAAPTEGRYWVEANCHQALTSTQYVYISGGYGGSVKSISCL